LHLFPEFSLTLFHENIMKSVKANMLKIVKYLYSQVFIFPNHCQFV